MNVWRLITHHDAPEAALNWAMLEGKLALGWGDIGDIKEQGYNSSKEIQRTVDAAFPTRRNNGAGRCLYEFCYTMKPGDLVILSTGSKREAVMEVASDYYFDQVPETYPIRNYYHQRTGKLVPIDADKLWKATGAKPKRGNIRWALIQCANSINEAIKADLMR